MNTANIRPKGVIFDMDGTLIDSLGATFNSINHGLRTVGLAERTPPEIMKFFGVGEDEMFVNMIGKELATRAYAACRAYIDQNMGAVPLHSEILELLTQFRQAGIPMAIFTGRSWDTTEIILKHHKILDHFVTVVAHDHVGLGKPSPEGLHLALGRMKLAPSEVIFVGDSWMDIRAAHNAGAIGVAATWDWLADRPQLDLHQPHHWAAKPSEVGQLWARLTTV